MAGDAFEESAMHDGSPIVHRDKLVSRKMTGLFLASGLAPMAIAIMIAMTNSTSAKPLSPEAMPLVVAGLAAMGIAMWIGGIIFGVLRTLVTKKAVHVKYGLWGPTIELPSIESAKVVDYDWTEFGGWGMKMGRDGSWAYVPRSGPCVEIVYRDKGKSKRVLVGAENASATVAAIKEARTHVRISDEASLAPVETEALEEESETEERGKLGA